MQAVREQGDWENWLGFFLRGVIHVSGEAAQTARDILLLREEHRTAINEKLGTSVRNGHRLLEYLYEKPIVSVSDVRDLTGTTYTAANNLVAQMVENGILHEITGRVRNRRFMYRDYVNLFHDPEPNNDT